MGEILVLRNCRLVRNHEIVRDDLWIENGKIINPEKLFFDQGRTFDRQIDCRGLLIAPGFIDLQINGGFGVDFSNDIKDPESAERCLYAVSKGILAHGVTAYCPTLVTSPKDIYSKILPLVKRTKGGSHGAEVLGVHVEGPFISPEKKGAHTLSCIRDITDINDLVDVYGGEEGFKNVSMVTLAPEKDADGSVVRACVKRGVAVSLGHSMGDLADGERAVRNGAVLITHLFNAMSSFHHRDPGLVGLLTSKKLEGKKVYYGIIADGIHTHPAALRVAYKTDFEGLVLVTDAICALGLADGSYNLGPQSIIVEGERATIAGTDTLCGAIASMFTAVKKLLHSARCSLVEAVEAASLHPALAMGIEDRKGSLEFGRDADFIIIDDSNPEDLKLKSTWIAGKSVYEGRAKKKVKS